MPRRFLKSAPVLEADRLQKTVLETAPLRQTPPDRLSSRANLRDLDASSAAARDGGDPEPEGPTAEREAELGE